MTAPPASSLTTARAPERELRLVGPAIRSQFDNAFHISVRGEISSKGPASISMVTDCLLLAAEQRATRVHVTIDSNGGNVDQAIGIYHALRSFPAVITSFASGSCCSSALLVFIAGDHRAMAVGTRVLAHAARVNRADLPEASLTATDFRRHADHLEVLDSRLLDLLTTRTGYRRQAFENEFRTEETLPEEIILAWGVAHEIEGRAPRCDPRWPDVVAEAGGKLPVPSQYLTSSFLRACRSAPPRFI
jgi:ATP-dependent protease ClpP protease subunit